VRTFFQNPKIMIFFTSFWVVAHIFSNTDNKQTLKSTSKGTNVSMSPSTTSLPLNVIHETDNLFCAWHK